MTGSRNQPGPDDIPRTFSPICAPDDAYED
jgi:hypothetical protein